MLSLPLPADLHLEPLSDAPIAAGDLTSVPGLSTRVVELYKDVPDHSALAIGGGGTWYAGQRTSRSEAIRLAVERCSDQNEVPCLLIAVDRHFTIRVPTAHRVAGVFTLAGERGMSDADKQQLAPIYGGSDWRALAKGQSGRWYAVSGAESETAAEDKALAACREAEQGCSLHAVSNFRVAPQ
jgi:hypothetical protein